MNKLLVAALAVTFSACAANPSVYKSTNQNYRPKGESKTVEIEARLVHKKNLLDDDYAVLFKINDELHLFFQLDKNGNGSLSCDAPKGSTEKDSGFNCNPHNNNPIGATCIGSTVNGKLSSSICSFTYNNEIAANFRF